MGQAVVLSHQVPFIGGLIGEAVAPATQIRAPTSHSRSVGERCGIIHRAYCVGFTLFGALLSVRIPFHSA